jgi:hypothetical protein
MNCLVPHPTTRPKLVTGVSVELIASVDELLLTYSVHEAQAVLLPDWVSPARRDNLWGTTCFELFIQPVGSESYCEFNFSPSTEWAAYRFSNYRDSMQDLALTVAPYIERQPSGIEVDLDLSDVPPGELKIALSAVIEETDGTKSYWALAHPPGAPDFHHPDCFALTLPAASAS